MEAVRGMVWIFSGIAQWLEQLRHPIIAYDHIPDRFYVISLKFLLLSRNVPQRR